MFAYAPGLGRSPPGWATRNRSGMRLLSLCRLVPMDIMLRRDPVQGQGLCTSLRAKAGAQFLNGRRAPIPWSASSARSPTGRRCWVCSSAAHCAVAHTRPTHCSVRHRTSTVVDALTHPGLVAANKWHGPNTHYVHNTSCLKPATPPTRTFVANKGQVRAFP